MVGAMARGWADSDPAPDLVVCDIDAQRASSLAESIGGRVVTDLPGLAVAAPDLLLLGVKPANLGDVAAEIGGYEGVVISILGGTALADIHDAFPGAEVIRVMPNLAAELGEGVICHVPPESSDERVAAALELLGRSGTLVAMDEDLIDLATAMSGCSPAYWARAAEGVIKAGVDAGLDPESAAHLVALSMAGTGRMLQFNDPADFARAVASPGGSTEAGLEVLDARDVTELFADAARASLAKMGR